MQSVTEAKVSDDVGRGGDPLPLELSVAADSCPQCCCNHVSGCTGCSRPLHALLSIGRAREGTVLPVLLWSVQKLSRTPGTRLVALEV